MRVYIYTCTCTLRLKLSPCTPHEGAGRAKDNKQPLTRTNVFHAFIASSNLDSHGFYIISSVLYHCPRFLSKYFLKVLVSSIGLRKDVNASRFDTMFSNIEKEFIGVGRT